MNGKASAARKWSGVISSLVKSSITLLGDVVGIEIEMRLDAWDLVEIDDLFDERRRRAKAPAGPVEIAGREARGPQHHPVRPQGVGRPIARKSCGSTLKNGFAASASRHKSAHVPGLLEDLVVDGKDAVDRSDDAHRDNAAQRLGRGLALRREPEQAGKAAGARRRNHVEARRRDRRRLRPLPPSAPCWARRRPAPARYARGSRSVRR